MCSSMRLRRIRPRPRRHGGRHHRVHEHTGVEELTGQDDRRHLVALAQRDGDDRALRRVDRHAALGEQADEAVDVVAQPVGHVGRAAQDAQRLECGSHRTGCVRRGEDERVGVEGEQLDRVGGPDQRAAAGPERLREGDGDEVDGVEHAVLLGGTATTRAEHAESVGLVVEEERVRVATAELDHLGEGGGVAAHRVDAVDDDGLARLRRQVVEDLGEPRRRRCDRSASWWRRRAGRR